MKTDFFFVYGTLKKDGLYAKQFDKYRISLERATINNMDLYKIGWFPGMIPGSGNVIGELHEYKEPDIVTQIMDRIEGYTGESQYDLFTRERKTVITESGEKVEAVVYIFNYKVKDITGIKPIKNGVWTNKLYKNRTYKNFAASIRNLIKSVIWDKHLIYCL